MRRNFRRNGKEQRQDLVEKEVSMKKDSCKVSVIVPVYNAELYLDKCVRSVLAQTIDSLEIILVDDGSTDQSGSMCDAYAAQDVRVRVLHLENGGPARARNHGIELAQGTYIGFVDSDDYIDLTMYEKLNRAAKDYEADLVISGFTFVGGNTFGEEGAIEPKEYFRQDTVFEGKEGMKKLLLGVVGALPKEPDDSRYGVSDCKTICRREVIEKNALRFMSEREILSEDTLFMVDYIGCHVLCQSAVLALPKVALTDVGKVALCACTHA